MSISWTLLKKSGRQSFARLGLTAMAIAIGVMLISYFTAGVNGLLGLGHRTNHLSRLVLRLGYAHVRVQAIGMAIEL